MCLLIYRVVFSSDTETAMLSDTTAETSTSGLTEVLTAVAFATTPQTNTRQHSTLDAASTEMSSVPSYGHNVTTGADTVTEGTGTGTVVTHDDNTITDDGLGTAQTSGPTLANTTSAGFTTSPVLAVTAESSSSRSEDQTGSSKGVNTVTATDAMQTTVYSVSTSPRVESTTVQENVAISLTSQVTTAGGLTSDVTSDVIPSDTPRNNATTLDSTPGLQEPGSTTLSPSTKHARTTKGYRVSGTAHTASASTHTDPASTHRVPASTHTASASTHTDPASTHRVPASTHTDPASTHTDPASTHRVPTSTHTDPASATTKPGTSATYPESTSKHPGSTFESQERTDVTTGKHSNETKSISYGPKP